MKYPTNMLMLLLDKSVTLIIDGERLIGTLSGFDQMDFVIEAEEGQFIINRRCVDMVFATPQESK